MKKTILFLLLAMTLSSDDFLDKYLENQEKSLEQYKKLVNDNMRLYLNIINRNLKIYYSMIGEKWGKNNVIFSDNKNIVYYSHKNIVRKKIDLDNGKVSIEVISSRKPSVKFFNKEMQNLKKQTINEGIKKELIFKDTNISVPKRYNDAIKEILPSTAIKIKDIKTKYLQNGKIVYEIKKPLQKNYIVKLASYYMPKIKRCSKKYHIDKTYILAIIHTESSFNPKAIVPRVPAVGLMQLVPRTGARDAYKFLTGEDKIPSIDYLLNPNNNIELGSAYIYKLQNVYLKGVHNREKLYLVTSTAYNTGIGSLYLGITGSKRKSNAAINKINKLSYNSLHNILKNRKKFSKEAVGYIDKVKKHMIYWRKNLDKFF